MGHQRVLLRVLVCPANPKTLRGVSFSVLGSLSSKYDVVINENIDGCNHGRKWVHLAVKADKVARVKKILSHLRARKLGQRRWAEVPVLMLYSARTVASAFKKAGEEITYKK